MYLTKSHEYYKPSYYSGDDVLYHKIFSKRNIVTIGADDVSVYHCVMDVNPLPNLNYQVVMNLSQINKFI